MRGDRGCPDRGVEPARRRKPGTERHLGQQDNVALLRSHVGDQARPVTLEPCRIIVKLADRYLHLHGNLLRTAQLCASQVTASIPPQPIDCAPANSGLRGEICARELRSAVLSGELSMGRSCRTTAYIQSLQFSD